MCGIWAIFGSSIPSSILHKAAMTLQHRGPDMFSFQRVKNILGSFLANHRLSIMDDVMGRQPIRLEECPHIWLVYNGEIYNYKEIAYEKGFNLKTNCDGETIIHLYSKYGLNFPAHLDGTFAFCLLDTQKRKVFIGRDTFGVRPCYKVHTRGGVLAVSSEVKGLTDVVAYQTKNGDEITKVHPGSIEEYDLDQRGVALHKGTKQFHSIGEPPRYSTFTFGQDVHENIRDLLNNAVRKRLMSQRRVGCLLSGGLDSSLVTALVVRNVKEMGLTYPVQTFCVGMDGSPDLLAARKVAEYLGTEHHEVVFTDQDVRDVIRDIIRHMETYDSANIRAAIGMYLVCRYIRERTDTVVILSGEGADELTQGYRHFLSLPTPRAADQESRTLLADLHQFDVLRADRCSAAWGLEVRVPFLDHQLTSYYLSLPPAVRMSRGGIEKHLLRSAFQGTHLLPEEMLWRTKKPFSLGVSSPERSLYSLMQDMCVEQLMIEKRSQITQSNGVVMVNHSGGSTDVQTVVYTQIFNEFFPNGPHLVSYRWLDRVEKITPDVIP